MGHLKNSATSIHLNDPVLRYTITMSRISQALQILFDNLYLFSRMGLIKWDHGHYSVLSCKFWLYADLLNIIRFSYELKSEITDQIDRQSLNLKHGQHSLYSTLRCVANRRPDLILQLVRNVADVWLPLNGAGVLELSRGATGLCGTVSSFLGLVSAWKNTRKLM